MIVQMHQTLLTLEDNTMNPALFQDFYEVDGFKNNSVSKPAKVQRDQKGNKDSFKDQRVDKIRQIKQMAMDSKQSALDEKKNVNQS